MLVLRVLGRVGLGVCFVLRRGTFWRSKAGRWAFARVLSKGEGPQLAGKMTSNTVCSVKEESSRACRCE